MRNYRVAVAACGILMLVFFGCASKEEKAAGHMEKAAAYMEKEDYKSAKIELKNALQLNAANPDAYRRLGETSLKLGEPREAFGAYAQLVKLAPEDLDARLKMATFYLLGRKPEDARKEIDFVLAKEPRNVTALSLLAGLLAQGQDLKGALDAYEKVLAEDPKQVKAYMGAARVLAGLGRHEQAEQRLRQAVAVEPDSVLPRLDLFRFYIAQRNFDQARQEILDAIDKQPENIDLRLILADFYFSQQNFQQAENAYVKAIDMAPNEIRPLMVTARFFDTIGQDDRAMAMYEKAMAMEPENAGVMATVARFQLSKGEIDKAETLVDKVLATQPKFPAARLIKGEIMVGRRQFAEAVNTFDQILKDEPRMAEAHYFLSLALIGTGNASRAKAALQQTLELAPGLVKARLLLGETLRREGNFPEALVQVEEVLKDQPDHYQALLLRGNLKAAQRDTEAAGNDYRRLVALQPENPVGYYQLGLLTRLDQKYEEAIGYFDQALQRNPKLMDVFTNKVLTLAAQKKWDEALNACTQQLAVVADSKPAQAIVHFMEGQIHKARNDRKAAELAFRKSVEANANYVQAYYEMARLYLQDNKLDEAVAQYEALLAKDPKQFGSHMQLGTIYDMQGRLDLAETHYREALKINPDFAPAANNLAYNLAEQEKNLDEALLLAQKAREKLPEDPSTMDTLGWVYTKKQLYDSAIRELQDSLAKLPDNAAIHYHLGMALLGKGETEKAREAFGKALAAKDAGTVADRVKKALEGI